VGVKEGEQEVRWFQAALRLQSDDPLKNVVHVWARAWKRGAPVVALARSSRVKGRQIDMVDILPVILHIEEGALPFLIGLLPVSFGNPAVLRA
jgi:hypothetical protein